MRAELLEQIQLLDNPAVGIIQGKTRVDKRDQERPHYEAITPGPEDGVERLFFAPLVPKQGDPTKEVLMERFPNVIAWWYGGGPMHYPDESDPALQEFKDQAFPFFRRGRLEDAFRFGACFGFQGAATESEGLVKTLPAMEEGGTVDVLFSRQALRDPVIGVLPDNPTAMFASHFDSVVSMPGARRMGRTARHNLSFVKQGEHGYFSQLHPEREDLTFEPDLRTDGKEMGDPLRPAGPTHLLYEKFVERAIKHAVRAKYQDLRPGRRRSLLRVA